MGKQEQQLQNNSKYERERVQSSSPENAEMSPFSLNWKHVLYQKNSLGLLYMLHL